MQWRDLEFGLGIAVLRLLVQTLVTKARRSVCSTDDAVKKLGGDD